MQKAKMRTGDRVQENIAYIAARFPHCVTEARGADGELVYKVDYDLLRQELSGELIEEGEERYCLNWPGKKESLLTANGWLDKTLRPIDAFSQHSTAQHSTAQHSTAQHSTAQHSTAQHSTAQHTAQHSTAADFV